MKYLNRIFITLFLLLLISPKFSFAQEDILEYLKNFKISTYVDVYYAYDTDKKENYTTRQYSTLSPYRNEFRLNIAQISFKYNTDKIRGITTLQYGDIPNANWIPPYTNSQFIQEANIGFSPYKNLWIDAGYFLTHIGNESMPKNNYFSTFAFPVYFEPFFQSGVKIGYVFSEKFYACLHILNGYNQFEDNNKNKSLGLQLAYAPNQKIKFTYNNIIGNEQPTGITGKLRVFNNLIINASPNKKIELVGNFDFCSQEGSKISDPNASAYTYGATVSGRYTFCPCFNSSLRGEFFQDLDGVLNGSPIRGNGITASIEYKPVDAAYLRLEYRFLNLGSDNKIFYENNNKRHEAVLSFGFEY